MSFLPTTKDWPAARPKDLLAGLEAIDHARKHLREAGLLQGSGR